MKRRSLVTLVVLAVAAGVGASNASAEIAERGKIDVLSRFDHEEHDRKVFRPKSVSCKHCHNFKVDERTGKAIPEEALRKSSFRRDFKSICHGCHVSAEAAGKLNAPQACYTCHRSSENLRAIKPRNHMNIGWAGAHATNARIDGDACLNCHMTSFCVQCHQRRNDIELRNHSRNFRLTHSVQARAQPHKCDSCHSRSFCVECHLGRKR